MPASPRPTPCGAWRSPIRPEDLVASSRRIGGIQVVGGSVCWLEVRPEEGGRTALVRARPDGRMEDVLQAPFSARTRAITYGGGSTLVCGERVWFVNDGPSPEGGRDQRLWVLDREGPRPITPNRPWRYACPQLDAARGRLICIREDWETLGAEGQPHLALVAVPLDGGPQEILVEGRDFVTSPTLSPDGRRLAWLAWDYPGMSWDSAELWLADLDDAGRPTAARHVAGSWTESCLQPQFSEDGVLTFVSDRGGEWSLYQLRGRCAKRVTDLEGEMGAPLWSLSTSTWAFCGDGELIVAVVRGGFWSLHRVDVESGAAHRVETGCTHISALAANRGCVAFLGAGPRQSPALMRLELSTGTLTRVRETSGLSPEALEGCIAEPRAIRFPTSAGGHAHAFYYPPTNKAHAVPEGERPPLLILSHGGPTSAAKPAFNLYTQFFTSRGFAVVDVDYRGSTGYGRAYRLSLYGHWGVYDVDDCVFAARWLIERGLADEDRVVARGGSAGGYVTLCLATFRDILAAGVSYFGVSDLLTLVSPTDNLELHYPDVLVGPRDQAEATWRERSPRYHADQVYCPMLFFQGTEDPAVLPEQTRVMVDALRAREVPVVEFLFEGEGHGFRKAETTLRCIEAELAFYGRVLGFTPADPVPPLEIPGLD
ncbi:MAG: S9 family peptidase [Alphaproteobacteria bacterium]|nr:S9 family peptidase [Alphaproteobacteria bacterium]